MTFLSENPTQLEFQISPDLAHQSWQQSQLQPSALGQWNAYLNQICLQMFLPWLQAEYEPQASVLFKGSLSSFWAVVNGTALTYGNKRLILIPDKSLDNSEYRIPQEWVDIPKLLGDYYLAIQINPDELSSLVWGYTTHQQIKTRGTYNSSDRTYSLDAQEIIQDLNVLWVVNQLNPDEQTRISVPNLSPVPVTQAENLLLRLVNTDIIQPRLELPFALWGELVSDDNWRQRLYQLRQGESQSNSSSKVVVNLSQWLQNTFEDSWQSLDNLFGNHSSLGFSLRRTIEEGNATIKRVKSLKLPNNDEAFLLLEVDVETDGRIGVRIQLRSRNQEEYLPPQTHLKVLSSSGQVIQSIQSRTQDNIIHLKRFKSPAGTQFSIQIEVDDFLVRENFLV